MALPTSSQQRVQVGHLELDLESGELLGSDGRVRLQGQSLELLRALLERPGTMVTREDLRRRLWPNDTFVDFEHGLNAAVRRLREALGDSADAPRFIETIPRKGYRLVASAQTNTHEPRPVDASSESASKNGSRSSVFLRLAVVVGIAVGAVAVGFRVGRTIQVEPSGPLLRYEEQWWGVPSAPPVFSVSPDGQHLVMGAEDRDGIARLWVRTLSDRSARPVPGTESAFLVPPFWSADSSFLAWAAGGPLKKVLISGGTPQTVCDIAPNGVGGSWNRDGVILSGNPNGGVLRCSEPGGASAIVTRPTEPFEVHLFPSFLPDGRRFIYLRIYRQAPERSGLYIGRLDSASRVEKRLMATGFNASYVPVAGGDLGAIVFVRDGALYAQRFDDRAEVLRGEPVRLADRVGSFLDGAYVSASPRLLAYREPDSLFQLTWFDRAGAAVARVGAPEPVAGLALSPDDATALVVRNAAKNVVDQDLWLLDLKRDTNPRRLTFAPTLEAWPVWMTNEHFVYGASGGEKGVYRQTVGGTRQTLFEDRINLPTSATSDGSVVLFTTAVGPATRGDVWAWTEGGAPTGAPLVTGPWDQGQGQLSSDRRWVAYVSNETGRNEVFVAEFHHDPSTRKATVGPAIPVSEGGGFAPRWRADGKELFYLKIDGSVMALAVDTTRTFSAKPAHQLFVAPGVFSEWGVSRDGTRLLFAVPVSPPAPLNLILNWQSTLGK